MPVSIFERPIYTSNNQSRAQHGYSDYSPAVGRQLLTLFLVLYSYALPREGRLTPCRVPGACGAALHSC